MKLYGAPNPAPNPRRVRIFLAEKGLDLAEIPVDLRNREHKSSEFREKNPAGQVPVLELEDGRTLSETVSICRYLEALHPTPALFGVGAFEMAEVDMWIRRAEFVMMTPVSMYWRHAHPLTAKLLVQYKDFGESNRQAFNTSALWFDQQLQDRSFLAGETFTMADICLFTTIEFADWIGLTTPHEAESLRSWRRHVSSRPSAAA